MATTVELVTTYSPNGLTTYDYEIQSTLSLVVTWDSKSGTTLQVYLFMRDKYDPDEWDELWNARNLEVTGWEETRRFEADIAGLEVMFRRRP